MDLLSAVLRELRLQSAAYRELELHAPWRLRFDGGLRGVHVVIEGSCSLTVGSQPSRELAPGDLVVLPQPDAHELASHNGGRTPALSSLDLAQRTPGSKIVVPGAGEVTRLVCGAFFFGYDDHPAVAGLPQSIHVPGRSGRSPGWLSALTAALTTELAEDGPGGEVVMARLSDALITRALRHHLESVDEPGWLRGLQDPYVAKALAAVHADLAAPWTVLALAKVAGLSRSTFAARFSARVGQGPMEYVNRCRMGRAMMLLRTENATVGSIAARVGYGSESAFANAFVRHAGVPPGAYRREARTSGG